MPSPKIKIHGIHQQIPQGYVLGRIDPGGGDPQLITMQTLGSYLVKTGAVAGGYTGALSGLRDVNLSTAATNGQVLAYDTTSRKWAPLTMLLSLLGDVNVTEGAGIDGHFLKYDNGTGKWIAGTATSTLAGDTDVSITSPADDDILVYNSGTSKWENEGFPITIQKDCGDETTAIAAATVKTFRMAHAMTLAEVRASLTTAQATDGSGGIFTVDVQQEGVSIFSTLLTIDNTETTSKTAATPAVLSTTTLYDDDEITVIVTQIGDGTAAGLKLTLIGTRSNAVPGGAGSYFSTGAFSDSAFSSSYFA